MKRLLIAFIRFYQRHISPRTPPSCRFMPTCSAYAIEAVERFGVIRGGALAVWRLLRCNPLGKPGYDPVPEKKQRPAKQSSGCCSGRQSCACPPDKTSHAADSAQDDSVSDAEK